MHRREFLESAVFGVTALISSRASAANAPASTKPTASPALRYEEWLAARHRRVALAAHIDACMSAADESKARDGAAVSISDLTARAQRKQ